MIFRVAVLSGLVALYAGAALAQQGADAPIPPPDAASSMSQVNPTAGSPPAAEATVQPPMKMVYVHGRFSRNMRERRETKALNWLEATGNGDFSDVRRDGWNYRATVTRDGTQQIVLVNPDTGQITPAN
jgi:hypothetical protein